MRIIGNNKVDRNLLRGMFSVLGATGLDAICRLLVVMILVRYYSKESFGVWAAITSVAAIVVTGDFGIINALRNKISQLLVEENESNVISQKYFYSAFYFFLLIAIVLALLLLCFTPYIPFESLFKTNDFELQSIGVKILIYVQIIFVFTIPLTIGNSLYFTFQESHFSALFTSLQAVFTVLIIYILSLCHVSIVFISIAYFLINTLFSFWGTLYFVFRHKWFHFKVSWRDIYKCNIELFKVGIKFMSLQLSSSFLQNAGTIIASAVLGVKIAADYSMYTKLYTLGIAIFQSVFNPLWGSYAAAIYRRDFVWCQRTYYYNLKIIFFYIYFI
ncbi:lipopolysaccharide biosynthesis protein [Bacteroides fragilis]